MTIPVIAISTSSRRARLGTRPANPSTLAPLRRSTTSTTWSSCSPRSCGIINSRSRGARDDPHGSGGRLNVSCGGGCCSESETDLVEEYGVDLLRDEGVTGCAWVDTVAAEPVRGEAAVAVDHDDWGVGGALGGDPVWDRVVERCQVARIPAEWDDFRDLRVRVSFRDRYVGVLGNLYNNPDSWVARTDLANDTCICVDDLAGRPLPDVDIVSSEMEHHNVRSVC